MKAHEVNSAGNFISGWYLEDDSMCDELISFHQQSSDKQTGRVSGYMGKGGVDPEQKDSSDVILPDCDLAQRYFDALNRVALQYIEQYPFSNKLVPWGVIESMIIQHYQPGGGFKIWHFERDNTSDRIARRHLAFMTYLNDVEDGGGTSFLHQDLTIRAEKGLTLIWPVEWTHAHKGQVSPTEEKYIITGWFSTYSREEFEAMHG